MTNTIRRVLSLSLVSAAAGCLTLSAAVAQAGTIDVRPFPLSSAGLDTNTGLTVLRPDPIALAELASLDRVVLTGFALPGEPAVELELKRIDRGRPGIGFQVNGVAAPGLLDGLAYSAWRGTVAGQPGSEVFLGFSLKGSHGWVRAGGELLHVLPQPGPGGDWLANRALLASEADLNARGLSLGQFCSTAPPAAPVPVPPAGPGDGAPSDDCGMKECSVAVETDYQLFQVFNDVNAEGVYLANLFFSVTSVYEQQIDTRLSCPYMQLYTTADDPWTTADGGFGDSLAMLFEFEQAWSGQVPGDAVLAHFVSGAALGGGVAWLGVLGDRSNGYTFAVSGDLAGETPFPIVVGPLNWDFVVFAHETGHNFGAPHTHDMVPPVDTCGTLFDCAQGTLMSYCHLPCGTMAAITPEFAPESAAIMSGQAEAHLPNLGPLWVPPLTVPAFVSEQEPTLLTVTKQANPTGPVVLNYHYAVNAPYKTREMLDVDGFTWTAELPAPLCGEVAEWFFSSDFACGHYETEHYTAKTGVETVVAHDDFEASSGWTSGDPGDTATDGLWMLGEPLGSGWQPEADMSPFDATDCWFTGQGVSSYEFGSADVDGGTTTLLSPLLDFSAGDAYIGYWLWFASDDAFLDNVDSLEVEISNDDGATWGSVETIASPTGDYLDFWTYHEFKLSNVAPPTAQVRLRFVVTDEGPDSTVEAAIDEFTIYRVGCTTTCQDSLGFGWPDPAHGGHAALTVCGGNLSPGTHASLSLESATPNTTATFFVSLSANPTYFKGGMLVPLPMLLLVTVPTDGLGSFSANVPGGHGPLSIYLQAVYPAPGTAPANIGMSNALRVDLLP